LLDVARQQAKKNLDSLPDALRLLDPAARYSVIIGDELAALAREADAAT
ncbi:MAG: hypothetical protein JO205_00195, partial [Pseudolabrys sp.]|nr:hypothetical protein [Pseudolabrys sp.]